MCVCKYSYFQILLSLRNEGNSAIHENLDEYGGHYTKIRMQVTERYMQHDSIYMRYIKVKIVKENGGCQRSVEREVGRCLMG
jgi:hypothetical protein